MMTLSLCMIVKNEEKHLKRCLSNVNDVFDEIIIVDTGSTDNTKAIAELFTDKIYDFEWIDDFSAARNFAFGKATSGYIMWLDADDTLPEETRNGIIQLKAELPPEVDVVRMPYHIGFENGKPTFTFYRERILRNCEKAHWEGFIHEVIAPFGTIVNSELPVEHHKIGGGDNNRNLRLYEKRVADGFELSPRDMFYYGRELYYHKRNQDAINVFDAFLAGGHGWIENVIDACRIRSDCYNRLKMPDKALMSLLESLMFDTPRAEIACDIGQHFLNEKAYKTAIFWFKQALEQEPNYNSGAFILPDCYGYFPALQLCVCYSRMKDDVTAYDYNEIAATYKVTDAITYNRNWFASLGIGKKE